MACADDDPNCADTLLHIDEFCDAELDADRFQQLQDHLEQCEPCLAQYVAMQDLRWRIAESVGCRHAPAALRDRILTTITSLRVSARWGTGAATMSVTTVERRDPTG